MAGLAGGVPPGYVYLICVHEVNGAYECGDVGESSAHARSTSSRLRNASVFPNGIQLVSVDKWEERWRAMGASRYASLCYLRLL